jgi:hypothetical protein
VGKCKGRRAVKLFLDAIEAMDASGGDLVWKKSLLSGVGQRCVLTPLTQ